MRSLVTKAKEKMLLLEKQQKLQERLVSHHRQVAASTMALVARDARTKCTAYRRVQYIPNPRPEVVEEVLRAKKAIDAEAIAQLAATIDEIADRYYSSKPSNATCVKPALENDDGVTMDIDGGNGHEVLGQEGDAQHDAEDPGHGDVLNRPQPIYSPPLSSPEVDWSEVRFKPALPKPDDCPVSSVSNDPEFYNGWDNGYVPNKHFGCLPGYYTTHGVMAVPTKPVGGYVYSVDSRRWILYASSVGRRTV